MKRKHVLTKALSSCLAGVMLLSLVACGKTEQTTGTMENSVTSENAQTSAGTESTDVTMKDTTINIRLMNEPKNIDRIVAEYENRVKDDPIMSKIHLNISFVTGADYKDKLRMAMTAQEDYDLMFCGSWHGMSDYITQDCFADLSNYFNNDEFQGLKNAFSSDVLTASTSYVKQEDGEYKQGIYGINLYEALEDTRGLYYREDLRKKYNCAPITDDASLQAYLETVTTNEPNMIGLSMYNGFFYMDSAYYTAKKDNVYWTDATAFLGEETPFYVALSDDNKSVLNAVVMGDSSEQFSKMPTGYQTDFISQYEIDRTKWEKYLDPARGTNDKSTGDIIVEYGTLTNFESKSKEIAQKIPGAEYGFYVTDEAQRNMEQGVIISNMTSNNWLVVPAWSEKVDATMYFLNWLYSSQENHDLFQYGIEGTDWEKVGTNGYKLLDVAENEKYSMPGYSFTWNPNYVLKSEYVINNEEISKRYDYMLNTSTYKLSPLAGFIFDPSTVETQIANVSALSKELMTRFALYGDQTQAKIDEWHKKAEDAGLEDIRAELIKQMQDFLNTKFS